MRNNSIDSSVSVRRDKVKEISEFLPFPFFFLVCLSFPIFGIFFAVKGSLDPATGRGQRSIIVKYVQVRKDVRNYFVSGCCRFSSRI